MFPSCFLAQFSTSLQYICQCHLLCWNGSILLAQGNSHLTDLPCSQQRGDVAASGPLTPSDCKDRPNGKQLIQVVAAEAGLRTIEVRDRGWLSERNGTQWRMGRSYLQPLSIGTDNIPDFVSRVLSLLLINRAALPTYLPRVDRALFPRDQYFRKFLQQRKSDGLHIALLQQLVRMAFAQPGQPADSITIDWDGTAPHSPSQVVEFEAAWEKATEDVPLCFQDVVLPGMLHGVLFPAGRAEAEIFHTRLRDSLDLPPPLPPGKGLFNGGGKVPRLLYIRRTDALVRVIDEGSRHKLVAVMKQAGFEVIEIELANVAFKEMAYAVRAADAVVGVHGAGLATAVALAGANTVIVEIMPFHAYSDRYMSLAVNSGLVYFQYQCFGGPSWPTEGNSDTPKHLEVSEIAAAATAAGATSKGAVAFAAVAASDAEFVNMSVHSCSDVDQPVGPLLACRRHFLRDRPVILWPEDLARLAPFLTAVHDLIVDGASMHDGVQAAAKERVDGDKANCTSRTVDGGYSRQDFLVSPYTGQDRQVRRIGDVCVLQKDSWSLA